METLLTIGFIGVCAAGVTAMHLHLTDRPPAPVTVRPNDDIDVEFFRIIDREGLRRST